jgi:hypothetical protein
VLMGVLSVSTYRIAAIGSGWHRELQLG